MSSDTVNVDLGVARRILRGDERAFRALFDSFFPRLYRFALARLAGDHDAANEVVQLTFCKGIERLDSYRGEAALYTWFCQICRNTLIDYCRSRRREMQTLTPLEDDPDMRAVLEALTAPLAAQPDVQLWRRDVGRLIQATIDALPERYGDALEWKYVDGLTVVEIAQRMQIGPKAAESILTRARGAFREAMTALADAPETLSPPQQDWSAEQ